MPDRENVIKRLEECFSASCRGFRTCPYSDDEWDAVKAALALLREQEPVKPDIGQVVDGVYAVCANCRYSLKLLFDAGGPKIGYLPKFCPECGKAVKWDDAE